MAAVSIDIASRFTRFHPVHRPEKSEDGSVDGAGAAAASDGQASKRPKILIPKAFIAIPG
jgi:hypothetical protein